MRHVACPIAQSIQIRVTNRVPREEVLRLSRGGAEFEIEVAKNLVLQRPFASNKILEGLRKWDFLDLLQFLRNDHAKGVNRFEWFVDDDCGRSGGGRWGGDSDGCVGGSIATVASEVASGSATLSSNR